MIPAMLGLALGLGAAALSVGGLWLVTRLAADLASGLRVSERVERVSGWDREGAEENGEDSSKGWASGPGGSRVWRLSPRSGEPSSGLPRATLLLFFTFLLKAPLFLLVAIGARSLGSAAVPWCVMGVVSVYCLAVFWAAARTRTG